MALRHSGRQSWQNVSLGLGWEDGTARRLRRRSRTCLAIREDLQLASRRGDTESFGDISIGTRRGLGGADRHLADFRNLL